MYRILFSIYICFLIMSDCFAGGDYGNWYAKTPFNNTLNNEYDVIFYSNDNSGKELKNLEKWYFYKSFIVGSYFIGEKIKYRFKDSQRRYFVINEKDDKIDVFGTENQWIKYRNDNNINPAFITNWHDSDWQFFSNETMINFGIISILLLILISAISVLYFTIAGIFVLYKKLSNKIKFSEYSFLFKKPVISLCILGILVLIRFLLDMFPQSI